MEDGEFCCASLERAVEGETHGREVTTVLAVGFALKTRDNSDTSRLSLWHHSSRLPPGLLYARQTSTSTERTASRVATTGRGRSLRWRHVFVHGPRRRGRTRCHNRSLCIDVKMRISTLESDVDWGETLQIDCKGASLLRHMRARCPYPAGAMLGSARDR